jgi:hypothetical protein
MKGELMKRTIIALAVLLVFSVNFLPAQNNDDDLPYLSEDDIRALEVVLPDDVPERPGQINQPKETAEAIQSEIGRLNSQRKLYQLIILDRRNCEPNANVGDVNQANILFKFAHLENGYLLVLYEVPGNGPVFPVFPKGSYILLDLMTSRINTIREYVNSSLLRRFITIESVISELNGALDKL